MRVWNVELSFTCPALWFYFIMIRVFCYDFYESELGDQLESDGMRCYMHAYCIIIFMGRDMICRFVDFLMVFTMLAGGCRTSPRMFQEREW